MNKAEIVRVVELCRVAQGKPTRRTPEQVLTAEKAVAAKSISKSPYTGSTGGMTAPEA